MRHRRTSLVVCALLVLLPACAHGSGRAPVDMGLKRVALDLAFRPDAEGRPAGSSKLPPIPAPIPPFEFQPDGELRVPVARPRQAVCPTAQSGAVPAIAVTSTIEQPPARGEVQLRNKGTLAVTAGPLNFKGIYPPITTKVIDKVTNEQEPPDAFGQPGARVIEFDVIKPLGDTVFRDHLRATATALELVEREIRAPQGTIKFVPTPAVTLVGLGTSDKTWTSVGVDLATGATMTVQGSIIKREFVDVCGEVFDTYRVHSTERLVSVRGSSPYSVVTDDTSNTPGATGPGQPNVYNVATQFGGVFLSEENHTTTTVTVDNVPLVVEIDVLSTHSSVRPVKP